MPNPHPSSCPYISGDSFRAFANMVYEKGLNSIVLGKIKENTIIFVCIEQAEKFFQEVHPHITKPYILITHNGDTLVTEQLAKYADKKINKWYAMSVTVSHPQITPIPAGLENLSYYNNGITKLFDKNRWKGGDKINRILFGFSISTNPGERQPAYDALIKCPSADEIRGKLNAKQYLEKLNGYKFVASPPGNAIDSHRMWEAMYLGVIPIVKRSFMMESFSQLGLPIWLVDDWQEIKNFSETELASKYTEIMAQANTKPLFLDYWINLIKNND
ncbi:MAG: hypothetical protein WC531_00095 [Candidatus Paceibacterota bacterium]